MSDRVLLVDANNLSLRALHGCPSLYDGEGTPTGCLMTTVRTLCKASSQVRPTRTFFVWDGGHSKFRKKIFPGYKVRPPADEEAESTFAEWKHQVELLTEYLPLLGVGQFRILGCEADDVIYRLRNILIEEGFEVVIASGDADFFQLVTEYNTRLYHLSREKLYAWPAVTEEYGITPAQFVDFRALVGDPSDKIDGVKGVGEKRAIEILKSFKTLEKFYACVTPEWLEKRGKKYYLETYNSQKIVIRNRQLMDLSLLPESEVPQGQVMALLERALDLEPDKKAFWNVCTKHQLNTLIQESHLWGTLYK